MTRITKWGPHAARVLLGLVFFVFGLDYFVGFLPPQPPPPESALPFFAGLQASGYILPVVKTVEVAAGAALLANRFVPLALSLLAPVVVNIVAIHFLLVPAYALPLTILALELYLAWAHRSAFAGMLRATPAEEPRHGEHAPRAAMAGAR
jgi:uncharacterized membrane protein YphA (DoxX/SURF4 family)